MWSIPATHRKTVSQSDRDTIFTTPHGSQTIVGVPCHRQLLPTTSILAEEHINRSASLRSTFRWKPRRKITSQALTRVDLRSDACNTVFTRASSSWCVCHRQANPSTPRAPPSLEKPFFFSFSLQPLLLCFSVA